MGSREKKRLKEPVGGYVDPRWAPAHCQRGVGELKIRKKFVGRGSHTGGVRSLWRGCVQWGGWGERVLKKSGQGDFVRNHQVPEKGSPSLANAGDGKKHLLNHISMVGENGKLQRAVTLLN